MVHAEQTCKQTHGDIMLYKAHPGLPAAPLIIRCRARKSELNSLQLAGLIVWIKKFSNTFD